MDYYNEIKNKLINNEINNKVKNYYITKGELDTYYAVGKMLSDAGRHYGEGIIKNYSIKLIKEVDKKYNTTNLKRMRQFYWLVEKGAPIAHQLSWSHYVELLPIKDKNKLDYYLNITIILNLSRNDLRSRIKSNEYERLDEETKIKLINNKETNLVDYVKEPILIKNNSKDYIELSEKVLKELILHNITDFMKELGSGFSFIDSEYKIKIDNTYNYIDILLFNYIYNCFTVIELKVTKLKKEHIGQIQFYVNYIDEHLKKNYHDKTIGIIICKENNKYVIKYSNDSRIISREFKII